MKRGLNLTNIKRIDKSGMLAALLDFPLQCEAALEIAKQARIEVKNRGFDKIIFAGMGGSAIGADLIRSYLYFESKIPIIVLREYEIPAYINSASLVFISSYSGNTEETISAYQQAKEKNAVVIVLSCGGSLKELAKKDNLPFVEIPKAHAPRCALGYLSIIPLYLLSKMGFVSDITAEVNQTVRVLKELRDQSLAPQIAQADNIAKAVARKIFNKLTIVYSASVHFDVCALRFRGQLAENSKALAWHHLFPEMNHNEIVGWENPRKLFKNLAVVMLRDEKMHPRVRLRMDITEDIIRKEKVEIIHLWSRGEGILSRMFSLIYTGDMVSYYLAILYGIDPTPVDRVTYLKDRLAKE